jgi:hypothetical protein
MEEKDDRFYIKESTIPGAGMGLFAKVPIKAQSVLPIRGVQVKVGSDIDKCTAYARAYKFSACDRKTDRHIVPLGYAALINHANRPQERNVEIVASTTHTSDNFTGKMVYRFIRDVEPDEEILGDYGCFWTGIFNWAAQVQPKAQDTEDDWQTFLTHDLYKLGELIAEITKE